MTQIVRIVCHNEYSYINSTQLNTKKPMKPETSKSPKASDSSYFCTKNDKL